MAKKNAEQVAAATEGTHKVESEQVAPVTTKKSKKEVVAFEDHTNNEKNPYVVVWGIRFNTNDRKFINTLRHTPRHTLELSNILANNAEIRRFTSIGICNILKQKGKVSDKAYIKFRVNKYVVTDKGLNTDYSYNEETFMTAFVAAFSNFANFAQGVLINYIRNQEIGVDLGDVIEQSKLDEVIEQNKQHLLDNASVD